jgi:hypothetical protein
MKKYCVLHLRLLRFPLGRHGGIADAATFRPPRIEPGLERAPFPYER